jgi:DNA recombination protein RmuC
MLIVVLLVVLILAVLFFGARLIARPAPQSVPTAVVAPTVDMAPIVEAVKAAIDVNAISTGVRGAVETQMLATAQQALAQNNEQAKQQANQTLESQQASLDQQTKILLQPFAKAMEDLNSEVTKLREFSTQKFGSVDSAVNGLVLQTQALNNVLSSAQGRGNWGERMLEDILSQSGLHRNINYDRQEMLAEGGRPDYSFFLPPDRVLYLDSKFPLENYVKYFEASDDGARATYKNTFIRNVEERVKELEKRDYVAQSNRNSLDYVLLFIPNEGVLGFIQQHKPSLIDDALAKKVLLCSPLTLYAFLGVVRQATDSFHMEQNANEVLSLLQSFSKAWKSYTKYLVEIQGHFDKIQSKLKAVTTGRVMSNLRVPLDKVDALAKMHAISGSEETLNEISKAFEVVEAEITEDEED